MRNFLLSLALLISAAAAAQVPSVTVENAKGEAVNTKSLLKEGTPMIVSFWSTSCKPCIRELDAVYDALPDWLEEAEFRVVAVSTDDSRLLAKRGNVHAGPAEERMVANGLLIAAEETFAVVIHVYLALLFCLANEFKSLTEFVVREHE